MTTRTQDDAFLKEVISDRLLENAIEWISVNMNPDDVFKTDVLNAWAFNNGFVEAEE